jgi:hypothetical protein
MKQITPSKHCDERAASEYLGVKVATIRDWRFRKVGPPFIKYLNKAVRYNVDDLAKFAEQSRVQTAA